MEEINVITEKHYESIYESEGYYHVATVPVVIPWFQCYVKCKCIKEQPMTELDNIVCKCVKRGINTVKDIAFVLALDERIVSGELEQLEIMGLVCGNGDIIGMTPQGESAFLKRCRQEICEEELEIYFNGVTGQVSYSGEWFQKNEAVGGQIYRIEPVKMVTKSDIHNNPDIKANIEKINNTHILSLELQDYKSMTYAQESLLIFKKEGEKNILFSIYDKKLGELDIQLAAALTRKYDRRELITILNIEEIVKENEKHILNESKIVAEYPVKTSNHIYYRNQEIRELFKQVFDTANKSIYIISPWIDNKNYVMTEELINKMEHALINRKIQITIGYGYISKEKMDEKRKKYNAYEFERAMKNDKDWQTELMAEKLRKRFAGYDNFSMIYMGTHEKVLCIDDRYTLIGSYNLLSYDGGEKEMFQGHHFRFEGGVMIDDEEFALYIKNLIS